MSTLRHLLRPPTFEDETKTHQAYIMHFILLVLFAVPVVYTSLIYFLAPARLGNTLIQSVASELITVLLFFLNRRGDTHLASILQVIFFWFLFNLAAYTRLGVQGTAYILGNATVIVIAGLLLGRKFSLAITFSSILAGAVMVYMSNTGGRFVNIQPDPSLQVWGICTILFIVINVVQQLSARTIRSALDRAQASEVRFRSLLENIPTITYINGPGPDSPTTYVSPQVKELIGYSREEFLQDPALWKKILHPDDQNKVLAENEKTSRESDKFDLEYRLISRDGRIVWVHDRAILVRLHMDADEYWLGVWTDITRRKQVEEEQADLVSVMTKRTIQLQTGTEVSRAASSMLDLDVLLPTVVELIRSHFGFYYVGIFMLDETKTMAVLKAATGDLGRTMLGIRHQLAVDESSMIGWSVRHRKARSTGDVENELIHFKNPHLPLTRSEMALPLISRGEVIGAMTIQSELPAAFSPADISALQSMADQIANAMENARLFSERAKLIGELESKNAELERFTYTVSHDLKSPLVTIRGFLGFLHKDAETKDMEKFEKDLARIANAADRMQTLLNDLLELSRIGRIANPLVEIPFEQIITETIELNQGAIKAGNVTVAVQPDLPVIQGDHTRLVEVAQNLIGNAIKFMGDIPNPRVDIGTRGQDRDGMVTLFIRDNGIGIDPEHHDRIFGLFNRLDPAIDGTGIGLTLVRRIIEVHGGRIWVESALGEGSTFLFTLPRANNSV